VILTPGHKQSGTHRIKVEQMEVSQNNLIIRVTKTSNTEKSTQSLTFPFTLLKVPRQQIPQGDIEVIFVDQHQQIWKKIHFITIAEVANEKINYNNFIYCSSFQYVNKGQGKANSLSQEEKLVILTAVAEVTKKDYEIEYCLDNDVIQIRKHVR
jgi:hypothetical protein